MSKKEQSMQSDAAELDQWRGKGTSELAEKQAADLSSLFVSEEEAGAAAHELLEAGGELATQVVTLEEGQAIRGVFAGWGAPFMFEQDTGEVRETKSVLIKAKSGKATARLIGNYDLVAKLDKVEPGTEVLIVRGATKKIDKGRTVAQFQIVIGPKPKAQLAQ